MRIIAPHFHLFKARRERWYNEIIFCVWIYMNWISAKDKRNVLICLRQKDEFFKLLLCFSCFRLETSLRSIERSKPLSMPSRNNSKHFDVSQRRFDSSLGSDTGTSTECSEEQQHSPVERPAHLYDSLAAELRAKLNGNGPPLLLPPRDYDTISR